MQQIMQVLQQQEGFSKLTAAQQNQLCMQLFLKSQQHQLIQQQQQAAAAAAAAVASMPQQTTPAGTPAAQNLTPRSASAEPQVGAQQPVVSMAGPSATGHPAAAAAFQRSTSQTGEAPSNWSSDTSPATSGVCSWSRMDFPLSRLLLCSIHTRNEC